MTYLLGLIAGLLVGTPLVEEPAAEAPRSPLRARGIVPPADPYSEEEIQELEALEETVKRFEQGVIEYREATRKAILFKYQKKRELIDKAYEQILSKLELEQRARRSAAIEKFEAFIARHPDDERYTPDAMFRLSELYFERSYDIYDQANRIYEVELADWNPEGDRPEPDAPEVHYEPTIAMMQRLIVEFPDYRLADGAYYLLGYCLGEQGEDERAVDVFHELVARRPDSHFAPEVWTRIGEYYFNANELERALDAYQQVLGHVESPYYDKALYKLAWTHYRMADPERAPGEYQLAIDTFVELLDFNERTRAEGKERGGELRKESVQYIAICYADEEWGNIDKMLDYMNGKDERPYFRDMLAALGDVLFDQTRFADARRAYSLVQERYPDHADAPRVQEKIVTAFERDRDFEGAANARTVLTENYSEGTGWWLRNEKNIEALRTADKLTEKALRSAALFHHTQAQTHKEAGKVDLATEAYGKAAAAYGEYLRRFPHDKEMYDLSFYLADCLYYSLQFAPAAEAYTKVRDSTAGKKYLNDSTLNVVLAYEKAIELAEQAGELPTKGVLTSADRDPDVELQPEEIAEMRLKAIEASDVFANLLPGDENLPKILYKAAETYYVHNHFEEARKRFLSLIETYPNSEVAPFASNLVIESYLAQQAFKDVADFAGGLLKRPEVVQDESLRKDLVKFKSGAQFKLAEKLGAEEKYEEAAELYLQLVAEDPDTEFADLALNNAAVAYEKVNRFDSASRLYERLVKEHPKSSHADAALFRVGYNAERFFNFSKAIDAYLSLVEKYPESDKRADASYNAALNMENVQDYEGAAQQFLRYCKLFPNRDDAPAVCFRAGVVYEKMGAPEKVISTYKAFTKKYQRNVEHRDRVIEAHLRIAKTYDGQKKSKDAVKHYEQAVKEYSKRPDDKGAPFAAEAEFQLVERRFREFAALKLTGSTKQQKKTLVKKAKMLKSIEESYARIVRFKQFDWTLASFFRIGHLYHNFAESLVQAECPPEIRKAARRMGATVDEVCEEYRALLEERIITLEDKAVERYETAVKKAREFQVVNEWTKRTLVALNKLRRSEWPLQKDAKFVIDDGAHATPHALDDNGKVWLAPEAAPEPTPEPAPPEEPAPATPPADGGAVPLAPPAEGGAPTAPSDAPVPLAPPPAAGDAAPMAPQPLAPAATPLGPPSLPPPVQPPPAPGDGKGKKKKKGDKEQPEEAPTPMQPPGLPPPVPPPPPPAGG